MVNLPDNPFELYAIQNVNLVGFGVADSTDGNVFNFRGIASASASLVVTYDADKHTIFLTLDVDSIIDDLPDASTTQRGVLETATDAEAIAKVATNKILVPANLAALGANTTFVGFIRIATQAEVNAGALNTVAVTPLTLVTYLANNTYLPNLWTDAVARNALAPSTPGLFGGETSSATGWVATGTNAGDWNQLLEIGSMSQAVNNFADFNTLITLGVGANFTFTGTGRNVFEAPVAFQGNIDLSLNGLARLYDDGVIVPASSVLTTSATAGQFNSRLLNTFISTANTQTGWAVTNPSVSRTLDVAAATLGDVRAVLGTLINDLKAVLLPAT